VNSGLVECDGALKEKLLPGHGSATCTVNHIAD
jgi:hypothetical protein